MENPLHKPFPLFLLGFGVTIAYIPGIVGAAISTGWLFLFISCPILFLWCDFKLGWGFAFICYAALSLLWTETFTLSIFNFLQYSILGIIFIIGQNIKDLKPIFKGIALGVGLSSIAAIFQYFGYHEIATLNNSSAGLFINPNIYSELSALLLIGLLVLNLWYWIPVTLTGLILVHSRTALLALAVGLFLWGWRLNKYLALGLSILILALGIIFYWDHFSFTSISERFNIWKDTIAGFDLFGNGVGSYEIVFPKYATHINTELGRPRYAHNDLLNIIYEFGLGCIFLILMFKNIKLKNEIVILFTAFAISMFNYAMHIPATAFITFLVAGYLSDNFHTVFDIRNSSGSNLFKRFNTKKLNKIRSS